MASDKPILICPAMNNKMLDNPFVRENINKLKKHGYEILDSGFGELACKTTGAGRLPDIPAIIEAIETLLSPKDFSSEKILITAGPTEEPMDPVRFITNSSSGKMGYALACAAKRRGAKVTLITGPVKLPVPAVDKVIAVRTAGEMHKAVLDNFAEATVVIKAAAVADYRPSQVAKEKIKKDNKPLSLKLERNLDILAEIGKIKGKRVIVGFAMETQNLLANAREKLRKKNLDFIIANDLGDEGAGFQTDTNIITIIDTQGKAEALPKMTKLEAADIILDRIQAMISGKHKRRK
jgi:phosphopantothenoylcysteine decarboxylase/phosphopantothenate--cysteine ligase